jgi:serine protease Do
LISAITPFAASLAPKARVLARWLVPLMPIALALAIVTWWPRVSSPRPQAGAAPVTAPIRAPAPSEDPEDRAERLLSEAIDRVRVSTVALEYNSGEPSGMRRVATGVVFTPGGDVISVRVEPKEGRDRETIVARDSLGHEHPARFVAADPETGLTLLKVEAKDEDIKPISPSGRVAQLAATVFLIGHPYDLGQSVSLGNVAGLNRRVRYGDRTLGGLIHVQVSLHPGDSGALLADRKGGWLGLIRGGLVKPDGRDDNNLGFAIPAPDALWVAKQLLAHRKVDRAYLGIQFGKDPSEPGARVFKVVPGSPAEKAGLLEGDRIVRLGDGPIRNPDDLTDRLDRIAAGTGVNLDYARGPAIEPKHVIVQTTSRPSQAEPTPRFSTGVSASTPPPTP